MVRCNKKQSMTSKDPGWPEPDGRLGGMPMEGRDFVSHSARSCPPGSRASGAAAISRASLPALVGSPWRPVWLANWRISALDPSTNVWRPIAPSAGRRQARLTIASALNSETRGCADCMRAALPRTKNCGSPRRRISRRAALLRPVLAWTQHRALAFPRRLCLNGTVATIGRPHGRLAPAATRGPHPAGRLLQAAGAGRASSARSRLQPASGAPTPCGRSSTGTSAHATTRPTAPGRAAAPAPPALPSGELHAAQDWTEAASEATWPVFPRPGCRLPRKTCGRLFWAEQRCWRPPCRRRRSFGPS